MPRTSAYTTAVARLAQLAAPLRADLHTHTTASDGDFTPSQVVAYARAAKLHAVAITDHDTLAAIPEAQNAAANHLTLIPGVEISSRFDGREVHLLGYLVRTDHAELNAVLAKVCAARRERFRGFVDVLRRGGHDLPEDRVRLVEQSAVSLGRRHVAALLVACGKARTRTDAFHTLLSRTTGHAVPKLLVPVEEAIELVRAAGGVSSLAHPPADLTDEQFGRLRAFGLNALEAVYPWGRNSSEKQLREVAARLGLAVSGGSDCHGADPRHKRVGSHAITADELSALRESADR
jgi:hypothetical protein